MESYTGAAVFQWTEGNFTTATAFSCVKRVYRQLRFHYFDEGSVSITHTRELSQTVFPVKK